MTVHPDVRIEQDPDQSWSVYLRGVQVRDGLTTREAAEQAATKTPSELVRGTQHADQWFARGHAAERITGGSVRAEDVCEVITFEGYRFDLFDLYALMWDAGKDLGDGTRLFKPRPGDRQALKWLIEDLSGSPTDPTKTMRANNGLRHLSHLRLQERGWAERLNQVSFRLLRDPAEDGPVDVGDPSVSPDEDGEVVVDVGMADVDDSGELHLGGLEWSSWVPLAAAAREATTSPGIYLARTGDELVYVGMAGERRGLGVRGRLQVYARGRGAVSGLGEAALDRALADPVWLAARLTSLRADGPVRAKQWASDALVLAELQVCWAAAPDSGTAREWETRVLQELEDVALWNRARPHSQK